MDVGHEQTVIALGHKTAQLGGGLAVGSGFAKWISENHDLLAGLGIMVGIAVGLVGLYVQYHFQKKRDERERLLHKHLMKDG